MSEAIGTIVGIGTSDFSRASGRSVRALAAEAARKALADAGLTSEDVDGVVPVGGSLFTEDVIAALGLRDDVFDALPAPGGNSGLSSVGIGEILLRSGAAEVVLVIFSRNGHSVNRVTRRIADLPGQQFREFLERPYGWVNPAQWYSMIARRYMEIHNMGRNALAEIALTMRSHAQLNPAAMMYGRPMTRSDYDAAPLVTDAYSLLDCCLETDGAVALLMCSRDRPHRGKGSRGVRLVALQSARPESADDLTNRQDWFTIGLSTAAPAAFDQASIGPRDVDTAMIYDCFTFEVLHQLEEAGFCHRGEGEKFVLSGALRHGGVLPTNTHGGLLSEGHLLGLSHVAEAVRQLRGEAYGRQVPQARIAAVTGWGDWGDGSMAILRSGY
jgi:acetyl-CoA acetyltransferase